MVIKMRETQKFDPRQEMHKKSFEVFLYREPKAATVDVHHHDFYEVYCFVGGEAEYWVEGHSYILQPGDLLLINPMELHRPIIGQGTVYERIVLWIDRGYLDSLSDSSDLTRCFKSGNNLLRGGTWITDKLYDLVRESYGKGWAADVYAKGIFMQLMVEINRLSPYGVVQQSSLISRVLEYIGTHYGDKLSLDFLSAKFYVSKYHLSHEFKTETGTSIYRYITLKRLAAARQMLIDGLAPGDACVECGFSDYTAFYKAFKTEYGISPNSMR